MDFMKGAIPLASIRSGAKKTKFVNLEFFGTLGDEQGWWLGMVNSDGGFYKERAGRGRLRIALVKLTQKISEMDTVERWGALVDSTYDVSVSPPEFPYKCEMKIYNEVFATKVSDLLFLTEHLLAGGVKTGHERFNEVIKGKSDGFVRGFVRGIFDGDSKNMYGAGSRFVLGFCSARKQFLSEIAEFLHSRLSLRMACVKRERTEWSLQYYSARDNMMLLEYMYPEGFNEKACLQSKYDKCVKWVNDEI